MTKHKPSRKRCEFVDPKLENGFRESERKHKPSKWAWEQSNQILESYEAEYGPIAYPKGMKLLISEAIDQAVLAERLECVKIAESDDYMMILRHQDLISSGEAARIRKQARKEVANKIRSRTHKEG